MTRYEIEVRVTGRVGVGKSTVAYLITKALREAGLQVNLHDDGPEITPELVAQNLERIGNFKTYAGEDTVVEVVTKQTPRVGWTPSIDPPSPGPLPKRGLCTDCNESTTAVIEDCPECGGSGRVMGRHCLNCDTVR